MIPGGRIKINICSQQVLSAKYYLGVALKGARLFAAIFLPKGAKRISATILNASENKIYGVNLVILPNRTLLNPGQNFSL